MAKKSKRVRSYERTANQPVAITPIEYSGLQEAFDHFNTALFDGALLDELALHRARGGIFE